MIKQETIQKIFDTVKIEDVIRDFVNLKSAGSNLKGYSPFTDEKTPSFMVSPAKQIWKDFSSNKGGNVTTFLMQHEGMTYPEALRWLAKRYNIEIKEEQSAQYKQKQTEREALFIVLKFAKEFYQAQMNNKKVKYLQHRNINGDSVAVFELGYAPDSYNAFTQTALNKGFQKEFLIKSGLTIERDNRLYDRFFGRLIFPIHSLSGRILGFGGRILDNSKKTAKYINSPENEVYHKSKILYGIYQAKQQIVKNNQCILVEGYTDVIAFHQAGIKNTVASAGTALTVEQIKLIKRFTNNILLIFDSDRAGISASMRSIDLILKENMNVNILQLPEGEDPDSFAQKHTSDEINRYIKENLQDFIRFKMSILPNETVQQKAELVNNLMDSIKLIPDTIKQEIYTKEVAQKLSISEQTLLKKLPKKQHNISFKTIAPQLTQRDFLELKIINLLLLHGDKDIEIKDYNLKDINEYDQPILEEFIRKTFVAKEINRRLKLNQIQFKNTNYKKLLELILPVSLKKEQIDIKKLPDTKQTILTDILMNKERINYSNWQKRNIQTKESLSNEVYSVMKQITKMKLKELFNENKKISKDEYLFSLQVLSKI